MEESEWLVTANPTAMLEDVCLTSERKLRPSSRHVTHVASVGHHMTATIIVPKAMPICPDQITSVHMTELNMRVNSR